jgi:hypothetical protein
MRLKCPACRKSFPWERNTSFPSYCQLCGEHIGHDRDDDDIVLPMFNLKGVSKSADDMYRQMEAGSEFRAHAAAEKLGVPVSEMSDLKITDLKDARHPGEVAAPEVRNEVTAAMAAPSVVPAGWQMGAQASGFSGAVQQGPWPNTGARFLQNTIRQNHREQVAKHCVGVDATTRRMVSPSTDVMSERPAVETTQPGYRRRT